MLLAYSLQRKALGLGVAGLRFLLSFFARTPIGYVKGDPEPKTLKPNRFNHEMTPITPERFGTRRRKNCACGASTGPYLGG